MPSNVLTLQKPAAPFQPHARGYSFIYYPNESNRCPGCGKTHWLVGRLMAECAFCASAFDIYGADRGSESFRTGRRLHNETAIAA